VFSFFSSLIPIGNPKSVIDFENQKIILRQQDWPKIGRYEMVICGDSLVTNQITRRGVETESFHFSQITTLELHMTAHHSGSLSVCGEMPKTWCRAIYFAGSDVFVANAAYSHIMAKCQNRPPGSLQFRTKISPLPVEIQRQLDDGEFDDATLENMRKNNVSFLEPRPRTIPVTPTQEAPIPQASPTLSVADELLKLKNLVDTGVITPAEFEREKRRLLS